MKLTLLAKYDNGVRVYRCPLCGDNVEIEPNVFYGQCPSCHATIIDYKPLKHQKEFLKSSATYLLMVGGYGSGKTTTAIAKLVKHALSVPDGKSLITGPKLQLINDAVLPELEKFIPPYFIKRSTKQPAYYELMNGHEIVVYASNDEQNLRSLNLSAFYIEEASAVDYSIFQQLQSRLRNNAAIKRDAQDNLLSDKTMGIVCTNPDDGWVRDKFLLYSKKIMSSKSVDTSNYEKLKHRQQYEQFASFLSSSRDNKYLPPQFIANLTIGKSREWIRKYIDCQLDVKEGAVYPEFTKYIVEPFPIPDGWLRISGFDRGWTDPTGLLIGAIDPKAGIIYVYDEYCVANQAIGQHAMKIKDMLSGLKLYAPVQGCPSILQTSDRDGKSYQENFERYSGIYIQASNYPITTGIDVVREYMYQGRIRFFSSLTFLKDEALKYSYREATSTRDADDTPIDKFNHLMDCLRYMIMGCPADPKELSRATMNVIASGTFSRIKRVVQEENKNPFGYDAVDTQETNIFKGGIHFGKRR